MSEPGQHRPGDVVNGHVLTSDGTWAPVGSYHPWARPPRGLPPGEEASLSELRTSLLEPFIYVQGGDPAAHSGLAPVTSLVSGVIGFLFCWIPLVGIIGWLFGPLALVFGFLGLSRGKAEHKIMSWIGIVLGAITLVVCLLYALAFAAALNDS